MSNAPKDSLTEIYQAGIVNTIAKQHSDFLRGYSKLVEKNIQECNLLRAKTNARLRLVGHIFVQANVVKEYRDIGVLGYPDSVAMFPVVGSQPIYLLNDCNAVVAATGDVMGQDVLTANLVMVSNASGVNGFYKRFENILNEDFDWTGFCMFLLNGIHDVIYRRRDVYRDVFHNNFKETDE